MGQKKKLSFEEALAELEKAVSDMKAEGVGLEESMKRFQEGMEYYKQCRELLDSAKQKIERYDKERETLEAF
ncbi:MAG: exodeoxyribonuclease VII small subunit [Anaerovoracaceae bacterium]|nr:exodeoxyribonuclease VII small subunit [Bacillota bacterium]MDY3954146.1 exodeoxyribonuclease VII small subunit [Anaerovoracaceae bacterium]